jgi:hypothetical protein
VRIAGAIARELEGSESAAAPPPTGASAFDRIRKVFGA